MVVYPCTRCMVVEHNHNNQDNTTQNTSLSTSHTTLYIDTLAYQLFITVRSTTRHCSCFDQPAGRLLLLQRPAIFSLAVSDFSLNSLVNHWWITGEFIFPIETIETGHSWAHRMFGHSPFEKGTEHILKHPVERCRHFKIRCPAILGPGASTATQPFGGGCAGGNGTGEGSYHISNCIGSYRIL